MMNELLDVDIYIYKKKRTSQLKPAKELLASWLNIAQSFLADFSPLFEMGFRPSS